jgi:hypothetical protein
MVGQNWYFIFKNDIYEIITESILKSYKVEKLARMGIKLKYRK